MSHYYSRIRGARGEATRCGHRTSGINASVSTWTGAIHSRLYWDGYCDRAVVERMLNGQVVEVLYDGPLMDPIAPKTQLAREVAQNLGVPVVEYFDANGNPTTEYGG